MSEQSPEKNATFQCIVVILKKCIKRNSIIEIAALFQDYGCLTRAQRKAVSKLVNDKKYDQALEDICEYAASSSGGLLGLLPVCADEDFPQKLAQLLPQLLEESHLRNTVIWMITSWDLLVSENRIKQIAISLHPGISDEDWLLDFIHHVGTTRSLDKEESFVQEAKKLLQRKDEFENSGHSPPEEAVAQVMEVDQIVIKEIPENDDGDVTMESDESDDGGERDPHMSYQASSFEMVNSDGEQEDNEENQSGAQLHTAYPSDGTDRIEDSRPHYTPQAYEAPPSSSTHADPGLHSTQPAAFDFTSSENADSFDKSEAWTKVDTKDTADEATKKQQTEYPPKPYFKQEFNQSPYLSGTSSFHFTTPENLSQDGSHDTHMGSDKSGDFHLSQKLEKALERKADSGLSQLWTPTEKLNDGQTGKASENAEEVERVEGRPGASIFVGEDAAGFTTRSELPALTSTGDGHAMQNNSNKENVVMGKTGKDGPVDTKYTADDATKKQQTEYPPKPYFRQDFDQSSYLSGASSFHFTTPENMSQDHNTHMEFDNTGGFSLPQPLDGQVFKRKAGPGLSQDLKPLEKQNDDQTGMAGDIAEEIKRAEGRPGASVCAEEVAVGSTTPHRSLSLTSNSDVHGMLHSSNEENVVVGQTSKDELGETGEADNTGTELKQPSIATQPQNEKIPTEDKDGILDSENQTEREYARTGSQSSSSEKSEESAEENESIVWITDSMDALAKYHHNTKLLVRLAWPKYEQLVANESWPFELIEHLENNQRDKQLIERFVQATKMMIRCSEIQLKTPIKESKKSGAPWLRSRLGLLAKSGSAKDKLCILAYLAWPDDEKFQEDRWIQHLIQKSKEESKTFEKFVTAAKILIEHGKDVDLEIASSSTFPVSSIDAEDLGAPKSSYADTPDADNGGGTSLDPLPRDMNKPPSPSDITKGFREGAEKDSEKERSTKAGEKRNFENTDQNLKQSSTWAQPQKKDINLRRNDGVPNDVAKSTEHETKHTDINEKVMVPANKGTPSTGNTGVITRGASGHIAVKSTRKATERTADMDQKVIVPTMKQKSRHATVLTRSASQPTAEHQEKKGKGFFGTSKKGSSQDKIKGSEKKTDTSNVQQKKNNQKSGFFKKGQKDKKDKATTAKQKDLEVLPPVPDRHKKPAVTGAGAKMGQLGTVVKGNDVARTENAEEETFFDAFTDLNEGIIPPRSSLEDEVEFRVVHEQSDPQTCVMYMVENCWYNWTPLRMQYDIKRGFHFLHLPVPEKKVTMQYKYCLQWGKANFWEIMPYDGVTANREITLQKDSNVGIIHDVPVFEFEYVQDQRWTAYMGRQVWHLLPQLREITLDLNGEKKDHFPLKKEVYAWVNRMKNGWKTTTFGPHYLSSNAFELAVQQWLMACRGDSNGDDAIRLILASVSITVAMHQLNQHVNDPKLLIAIFHGLSMQKLNVKRQKMLHTILKVEFDSKAKSATSVICDMLLGLFNRVHMISKLDNPVTEWLLALPIYWMMAKDGDMKQVSSNAANKEVGLLEARSALPTTKIMSWSNIHSLCLASATHQRSLLDLAKDILQVSESHSWILSSYLYMLSDDSLIDFISKDKTNEIGKKFQLDSIFHHLLAGWITGRDKHKALANLAKVEEYLATQFQLGATSGWLSAVSRNEQISGAIRIINLLQRVQMDLADLHPLWGKYIPCVLKMAHYATEGAYHAMHEQDLSFDGPRESVFLILHSMLKRIKQIIQLDKKEIQFCNFLLALQWSDKKLHERWMELILQELTSKIETIWTGQHKEYLDFYVEKLQSIDLEASFESCLEKHAFQCTEWLLRDLEKNLEEESKRSYSRALATRASSYFWREKISAPRFAKLFGKLFIKEYGKIKLSEGTQGLMKSVTFITQWTFGQRFFQVFYKEEAGKSFPHDVSCQVDRLASDFLHICQNFQSGQVKLSEARFLTENKEQIQIFYDTLKAKNKKAESSVDHNVVDTMKIRETQVKALDSFKGNVSVFTSLCLILEEARIRVDTTELENMCPASDSYLTEYFSATAINNPRKVMLTYRGLSAELARELDVIYSLSKSCVFNAHWKSVAIEKRSNQESSDDLLDMDWKDVIVSVWKDVKTQLQSFVSSVADGSATISTLSRWITIPDYSERLIFDELLHAAHVDEEMMKEDFIKTIKGRSQQIHNIFDLKKCVNAAETYLSLKDVLDLQGDFTQLKQIQRVQGEDDTPLNAFNIGSEENYSKILRNDSKFTELLEKFVDQGELIKWLKNKMNDLSEVKVFCDLAMISAGETSYEVDRVSFLLSAVMGFAPLIFDLTKESDMKMLLDKCNAVWTNFVADSKLIDKWVDTGHQLAWFEGIQKFHGSVETHSLILAQEINKHGTYIIRKPAEGIIALDKCVRLAVQDESQDAGAEPRFMNFSELHDLQSKLMLIAGEAEQGQQEVARFNDLLAAVESLAKAFVNLFNAGCMLFNDWQARISCTDEHQVTAITFSEGIPPMSNTTCLKDIELLADVLIKAHEKWLDYLNNMRLEHYYLNDYSIQQITYLCGHLAKHDLTDQVYSLLSSDPKNEIFEHIQRALDDATRVNDEEGTNMDEDFGLVAEGEDNDVLRLKKRMVRALVMNDELDENLAKAAVQCEENKDIADCENWALLNQHEEVIIAQLCADFDEEEGFAEQRNEVQDYASLLHDRTESTLQGMILHIQKKSLDADADWSLHSIVNTICKEYYDKTSKLTLQDFLSIEHLGKFLTCLRPHISTKRPVNRELVPPMQIGKPNLVICPQQDVLHMVLSMYMTNTDHPLPTRSEVLVCSENTNADEVERFMRRAMCKSPSTGKELFCMAFADRLGFNISTVAESIFNKLSSNRYSNPDYQLVILSSTQQHYLVTCFDKSQIEMKLQMDVTKISQYLFHELQRMEKYQSPGNEASVKIVSSQRSGVGKSLYVQRLMEEQDLKTHKSTIRLLERSISIEHVIQKLHNSNRIQNEDCHLIHLDLSPAVQLGIEEFFFNLFILGSIEDNQGRIWHHLRQHFYVVEVTEPPNASSKISNLLLQLLPRTRCASPIKVLQRYAQGKTNDERDVILMDAQEFRSEIFQRPYQYLKQFEGKMNLDQFVYKEPSGTEADCIQTILKHCGMKNPSWAQLRHFASFLNVQLNNCERSIFCKKIAGSGRQQAIDFQGLKGFAVRFMIKMAQDFATPSLNISDESGKDNDDVVSYKIRRRWEDELHPFIFFNEDGMTMTFINVNVDDHGNLLDESGNVKEAGIISKRLVQDLKLQGVPFGLKFNTLTREKKLCTLCQFMDIPRVFDPDITYELTTDNTLKMLAIYMRLRCQIPVIVMGETGCGKTRMVEFMSKLKAGQNETARNMITLKIHGGIKITDIYDSVEQARKIAMSNKKDYELSTILFFDEANTTGAITAIKEVVCDGTIDGESFKDSQLRIVAACNPYKRLSKKAIKKLEDSGLGYSIKANQSEQLGTVPMRTLVYRVVALPPSMQPFVWDFGQLGQLAEQIYIRQMTSRLAKELKLSDNDGSLIHAVLFGVQCYVRKEGKDECRYVSLRDVERSLQIYEWFHNHAEDIFPLITNELMQETYGMKPHEISNVARTLLLTVGVSYYSSLDDRNTFRKELARIFCSNRVSIRPHEINREFVACQTVFLRNLKMDDNIACNEALRENVFLIAVCTNLRIPLFVVGKPGSSKSLAKTIVADNMQGATSHSSLFRKFKQLHILSYQCSGLTDAVGIESIFNQCAQLQANQDLDAYVAVVVLDEIGLAEDSPNMPLKVLHPLLECGSTINGTLTEFDPKKKVGFVGISNWALDPAKMNRGIFVTRSNPDKKDLKRTAKGIFENQANRMNAHADIIDALTDTYLELYKKQQKEYFGLRDYYCLVKMVHALCKKTSGRPPRDEIEKAVLRNFSGGEESYFRSFEQAFKGILQGSGTDISVQEMVLENLGDDKSRFLLLLTNQYSAVGLLQNFIKNYHERVQVIFGSSFPNDHSYTEVCRNINRIKVCMETGRTVVLLNMTEINESLYDALNQHYVSLGGQRYVDLGLGGHRVKCRIAEGFRLIVIEVKEKVFNEYPIPLINRLEKHHLTSRCLLSGNQKETAERLRDWASKFSKLQGFSINDAFLGYHEDTVSSVVFSCENDVEICKHVLLQSATMDAVFRLSKSQLGMEFSTVQAEYVEKQVHDSLVKLLSQRLETDSNAHVTIMEITSFSNILSDSDRRDITVQLGLSLNSVMLLSLQQFQTEQDYHQKLDEFFKSCFKAIQENMKSSAVLLIQCPQAHKHQQLIACARYGLLNKLGKTAQHSFRKKVIVAFLLSTQRKLFADVQIEDKSTLTMQHTSNCEIIYVDELRPTLRSVGQTKYFHRKTICQVLEEGRNSIQPKQESDDLGLHMPLLIQDCICESMAKIKTTGKQNSRNMQCIKVLSKLCSDDSQVSYNFLFILLTKMVEVYKQRESEVTNHSDWVVQEACSAVRLQEGGTFAKTLWLCLKRHLSNLLAFIMSFIDRDNNLDIVVSADGNSTRFHNMWLEMFDACQFKWEDMRGAKEFWIESHPVQDYTCAIKIPFSFLIHQSLKQQWTAVQHEQHDEKRKIFFNHFRSSNKKMMRALSNVLQLPKPLETISAFAQDLTVKSFGCDVGSELQVAKLTKILVITSMKMKRELGKKKELKDGDMFLIMYYCSKIFGTQLRVLLELFSLCPEILNMTEKWIDAQEDKETFTFHEMALDAALLLLNERALVIKDAKTCTEWMDSARRMKPIFHSVQSLINDVTKLTELKNAWEPMAMLDLLLLQLLPHSSDTEAFKKYVEVVAAHARLLYKGTRKSGIRSQQLLRILCNVLRKYYEDVQLKISVSWQNTTCMICRSKTLKEPVELPCGHIFCKACLTKALLASDKAGRKCQLCSVPLQEEFEVAALKLTPAQETELFNFQFNCTSFFLEYLSQFCFPVNDESDPDESMNDQMMLVFEELVLEKKSDDRDSEKIELEKLALNLNIATCSNIFYLIHQYDAEAACRMADESLERPDINVQYLMKVIILAFEEIHLQQMSAADYDEQFKKYTKIMQNFRSKLALSREASIPNTSILRALSEIRCAANQMVIALHGRGEAAEENEGDVARDSYIYSAQTVCRESRHDVLRQFLAKSACRVYGTDWFTDISNKSEYQALIPDVLKQTEETNTIDYWTVLGGSYTKLRAALNKVAASACESKLPEWFPANPQESKVNNLAEILAMATWLKAHAAHKQTVMRYFSKNFPESTNMLKFLTSIFESTSVQVSAATGLNRQERSTICQLITLTAGVVNSRPQLADQLNQLMTNPSQCLQLFWPAMPESGYFSIPVELRTEHGRAAMYRCPNGHYYTIGQCTKPYTRSRCPDCKAIIGGRGHTAEAGNERVHLEESSQAGYRLNSQDKNLQDPADRTSKQGVAILQLILHSCMYIGLHNEPSAFACILPGSVSKQDAQKEIITQIKRNLEMLTAALGRNMDDSILVTIRILINILNAGNMTQGGRSDWSSIANRKVWEKQFHDIHLSPVFQNIDANVQQAQKSIIEAEDLTSLALYRLVHEIGYDERERTVSDDVPVWQNPAVWCSLEHSNAAHLLQSIRDNPNPKTGEVLQIILQTPDIHLLQYLEDVLKLQKELITKYQNKIDMDDAEEKSLHEFHAEEIESDYDQLVMRYIEIWNMLYGTLQSSGECDDQMVGWLNEINIHSPISVAMPSLRGRGRCAKLLVEHLIEIQNKFLNKCMEVKSIGRIRDTDVSQLISSHFIHIDEQKDLLPMIRLHTAYDITEDENGRHHHISYNIDALEKQAREQFVKYKTLIKLESLPVIKYPQDIGIGSDWDKVIANTKQQEPLSRKLVQSVEDLMQGATPADVCEAVRTLTYAISFLAKVECDSSRWLLEYLERDLLLSKSRATVIPKSAKIQHTLALYQYLTWKKAVNFVQLGLNPYQEALHQVKQERITEEKVLKDLNDAFEHMDVINFQQHVNEMLIQVPDHDAEWSLVDLIFPNLLFIGDETNGDSWFERIPSEICFKHVSHLFELAVTHIQSTQ